ncbi:3-dehydroquinate dehydratase [Klebsiella michiganensis]|nr:3-dehydroquinate dehydratase [Klebsiella michiganensis]
MVNDKKNNGYQHDSSSNSKKHHLPGRETLICVPLIGKTLAELQTNARALATAGADIIEWRVDHFTQVRETEQVLLALGEIRQLLKEIPLLFTFRSKKEGGETEISDEAYLS